MTLWRKISAGLLLAFLFNLNIHAQQEQLPTISVSGEAVVNIKPDKIIISFGIETWDKNLEVAKKQNDEIMERALAAIRKTGVAAAAIETDILRINPDWISQYNVNKDFQSKTIRGYNVSNRFVVNLTDVAKIEEVVSHALEAGVNNIDDISFQHTQFKLYREQARDLAIRAAQEKAQKMAASLGHSIGNAVQISEGHASSDFGYSSRSSRQRSMSQNAVVNIESNESEPENIALGKIAIRANVNVVFNLKTR